VRRWLWLVVCLFAASAVQAQVSQPQQSQAQQPQLQQAPAQAPPAPEQEPQTPPSAPEPPSVPLVQVFGGYSYAAVDPYSTNQRTGLNGFEAALNLNVARWLGLVVDIGGNYGNVSLPVLVPTPFPPCTPLCPSSATTFSANTHLYTYLFGANLPYRKWPKFTPFAQLLFGRAHVSGSAAGIGQITPVTESDTKFAYALGVGADYKITQRLSWRVQADYLHTKSFGFVEDNYLVSTGVVWHLTRKKKNRTLVTP
jgi:opacity protein-like surface antigen